MKVNLRKTFGKFDLTKSPIKLSSVARLRTGLHVGIFQMSRIFDTYTRCCQNSSCSNAQGISEHPDLEPSGRWHNEEPVILHDGWEFSGEGLKNDEWKSHLFFEEPIGGMLTAKLHVFSDSVFCTEVRWIQPVFL